MACHIGRNDYHLCEPVTGRRSGIANANQLTPFYEPLDRVETYKFALEGGEGCEEKSTPIGVVAWEEKRRKKWSWGCLTASGAGIFIPIWDLQFPVSLRDYTLVYDSELLAVLLALRRVPAAVSKVLIPSDSLSLISALASGAGHLDYEILASLCPCSITDNVISWVPGHAGIFVNEMADQLAQVSLSGTLLPLVPLMPRFLRCRFRSFELHKSTQPIVQSVEFDHLRFPWYPNRCSSRAQEVLFAHLRCRFPNLNLYSHRIGFFNLLFAPHAWSLNLWSMRASASHEGDTPIIFLGRLAEAKRLIKVIVNLRHLNQHAACRAAPRTTFSHHF